MFEISCYVLGVELSTIPLPPIPLPYSRDWMS